jgi:serine/threonine protein kinase
MEKGTWNLLAQFGSHGVLWILSIVNVLPLSNGDNQGGYGVVHKVWIKRFDCIPRTIELVGKTPKTNDKWETCKQWSTKALACSCKHLSVIKFFAIHTKTMEAYTLWWNGGTLQEMLDYNTKYSPITDNQTLLWQGGPDMEGWTWIVTFRWNRVKLAWAFINIMNVVHHCGILHNDLFKENIMLHFSGKQTKCCVHRHVWLGWSQLLAKGDAIIAWLYKGTRCHQH